MKHFSSRFLNSSAPTETPAGEKSVNKINFLILVGQRLRGIEGELSERIASLSFLEECIIISNNKSDVTMQIMNVHARGSHSPARKINWFLLRKFMGIDYIP